MAYDDVQSVPDGDSGFFGVNLLDDPQNLPAGMAADAVNIDFRSGDAAGRLGMHTVGWAGELGLDFPIASFPVDFHEQQGFGKVYGEGEFSDPNSGREYGMMAVGWGTYLIESNALARMVLLPVDDAGIDDEVTLLQTFNTVLMFRGPGKPVLKWDPGVDERWQYVSQTAARGDDADNSYGDGTEPIPESLVAAVASGRVLVADGDEIAVGDIFDYTRYSKTSARFRINEGEAGDIVSIYPFTNTDLVVFKRRGVYLLGNVYGSLSDVRSDRITKQIGLEARRAVTTVGKDVWFLGRNGIYSVAQTVQNEKQSVAMPISRAIQPLIERINWNAASGAVATYYDSRYYLAVPLDGAAYNNVLLVYDVLREAWCGQWTNSFLDVRGFVQLLQSGRRGLMAVLDDKLDANAAGALVRFNAGPDDHLFATAFPVETRLKSRAYSVQKMSGATTTELRLQLSSLNPEMSVQVSSPGVGGERMLATSETRNRLQYFQFGKADWDPTNINDDHAAEGREDYAVEVPDVDTIRVLTGSPTALIADYAFAGFKNGLPYFINNDEPTIEIRGVARDYWEVDDDGTQRYIIQPTTSQLPPPSGWVLASGPGAQLQLEYYSNGVQVGVWPPFNPALLQRVARTFRCSVRADFVQVQVENKQGRLVVHEMRADALQSKRSMRMRS